jgi:hypothetical protein
MLDIDCLFVMLLIGRLLSDLCVCSLALGDSGDATVESDDAFDGSTSPSSLASRFFRINKKNIIDK